MADYSGLPADVAVQMQEITATMKALVDGGDRDGLMKKVDELTERINRMSIAGYEIETSLAQRTSELKQAHQQARQVAAATATTMAALAGHSGGTSRIPKIDLQPYDGTGDIDKWKKRCEAVFTVLGTPAEKQSAVIFLNSLKWVALTHIDEWPMAEINSWPFAHMVEVLRARFELTIKQAAHRQQWQTLTVGGKESLETFYDRFTKAAHKNKPPVSNVDQYWRWYQAMPDWIRDRLNMSMSEEGGTLQEAVVLTRKAMAGITIAYGQQQHRPDQLSPPTDPNGPSEMEINALRRDGVDSGKGRGRGRGRSRGKGGQTDGSQQNDKQKGQGKSKGGRGTGQQQQGQRPDNKQVDNDTCHKCGGTGHWARSCPSNEPPKKR